MPVKYTTGHKLINTLDLVKGLDQITGSSLNEEIEMYVIN